MNVATNFFANENLKSTFCAANGKGAHSNLEGMFGNALCIC